MDGLVIVNKTPAEQKSELSKGRLGFVLGDRLDLGRRDRVAPVLFFNHAHWSVCKDLL